MIKNNKDKQLAIKIKKKINNELNVTLYPFYFDKPPIEIEHEQHYQKNELINKI